MPTVTQLAGKPKIDILCYWFSFNEIIDWSTLSTKLNHASVTLIDNVHLVSLAVRIRVDSAEGSCFKPQAAPWHSRRVRSPFSSAFVWQWGEEGWQVRPYVCTREPKSDGHADWRLDNTLGKSCDLIWSEIRFSAHIWKIQNPSNPFLIPRTSVSRCSDSKMWYNARP
jgi:hypothetical protein